jgi:hypothetical protein
MPSTATITAFYTFISGTKARASQVNANFDNYRGTLIPINTDTISASHQTHDLGSTDHQWKRLYVKEAPYINGNQVGKLQIQTLMDGSSPCDLLEDDSWLTRTSFRADETTGVMFQFQVPDEYSVGNRISLSIRGFCDTATAHFTLESGAALYKDSLTSMSATSPANVLTSTSNIAPVAAGQMFTNTSLRLTDASGLINSLTVTAGDVIAVYLKRTGNATADTNTGYFHLTGVVVDLNN